MFVTYLISAIAVITMSPNCLAHKPVLQSFLMKPYQLVSNDINFDKILQELDIGWLWRKGIEMEKPLMELTWNPDTDIYTFTEKYSLKQFVAPFKVVITTTVAYLAINIVYANSKHSKINHHLQGFIQTYEIL